jgi:hypothetical protein
VSSEVLQESHIYVCEEGDMRILTNLAVIIGVIILAPQSSRAELMESFVKKAFCWQSPEERPHLMLSRGIVLAWLKDPSTFLPVNNAQGYYDGGDRSMVIRVPKRVTTAIVGVICWPIRSLRPLDCSSPYDASLPATGDPLGGTKAHAMRPQGGVKERGEGT